MDKIRQYAKENYIPIIRDETAVYLVKVVKEKNPQNILEIGTAIGYSGLLMLENSKANLWTIEKDEKRCEMAKENFNRFNMQNRVKIFNDDASNVLEELVKEDTKFDMVFLDGPKGQYRRYYPLIKQLLQKQGVLFTDNVYLQGLVKQTGTIPHKHRSMVRNLKEFLVELQQDQDFETTIYDIDDGFSISYFKK